MDIRQSWREQYRLARMVYGGGYSTPYLEAVHEAVYPQSRVTFGAALSKLIHRADAYRTRVMYAKRLAEAWECPLSLTIPCARD